MSECKNCGVQEQTVHDISLFLTEDCNLACDYCFVNKEPQHIDLQTAKNAIIFLLEHSGNAKEVSCWFFGGEPLVKFDIIKELVPWGIQEALKYGKRIRFGATTNGTLLTDEVLLFWKQYNLGLLLSVDGDEETQDRHRKTKVGTGSFALLKDKLPKIISLFPGVTARMTFDTETVQNLHHNFKWAVEQGFTTIAQLHVIEDDWQEEHLEIMKNELYKIADDYINLYRQGRPIDYKIFDDYIPIHANPSKERPISGCGRANGSIGVSVQGKLFPCHRFVTIKNEDIDKFIIGDIYKGIDYEKLEYVKTFSTQVITPNKKMPYKDCFDCPGVQICIGGCIAANYQHMGKPNEPPFGQCAVVPIWYEVAGYVYKTLLFEKNRIFYQKFKLTPQHYEKALLQNDISFLTNLQRTIADGNTDLCNLLLEFLIKQKQILLSRF